MAELISATKTATDVWVAVIKFDDGDGVTHRIQVPTGTGEISDPSSVFKYKNPSNEDREEEYTFSDMWGDGSSFRLMGYYDGGSVMLDFEPPSNVTMEGGVSNTEILNLISAHTYTYTYKDDNGNTESVTAPVYTIDGQSETAMINLGDGMNLYAVAGSVPKIVGPEDTDGKRLVITLNTAGEVQDIAVKSSTDDDIYIHRIKDLGLVSAYGAAKEGGWSGTEDQFNTRMADIVKGKIPVNPSPEPTEDGSIWITTT